MTLGVEISTVESLLTAQLHGWAGGLTRAGGIVAARLFDHGQLRRCNSALDLRHSVRPGQEFARLLGNRRSRSVTFRQSFPKLR